MERALIFFNNRVRCGDGTTKIKETSGARALVGSKPIFDKFGVKYYTTTGLVSAKTILRSFLGDPSNLCTWSRISARSDKLLPPAGPLKPGLPRLPLPGQAFVELALIMVLVLFLCLATIDMGRAFVSYLSVAHAARDGARVGTIAAKPYDMIRVTVKRAAQPLTIADADIVIDRDAGPPQQITVQATYRLTTTLPMVSELWGGGELPISSTMISRVEQ